MIYLVRVLADLTILMGDGERQGKMHGDFSHVNGAPADRATVNTAFADRADANNALANGTPPVLLLSIALQPIRYCSHKWLPRR